MGLTFGRGLKGRSYVSPGQRPGNNEYDNPEPQSGRPQLNRICTARSGASYSVGRIPRALPWADLSLARWAGKTDSLQETEMGPIDALPQVSG